jgi:hypothetical protein
VTIILESFDIASPEYGKPIKIDLAEGMESSHIDFIEQQWEPVLKRQYDLALMNFFQLPATSQTHDKWIETLGSFGVQDSHWQWRTKCSVALGTNRHTFSLLNASEVEAAMVLLAGKQSRDVAPLPIVYVDYVAVAPWNRNQIQNPQRFRHLGTVMLGAAVAKSISLGHEGRCGLHSLPQSEGFYQRIGMTDFGIDSSYSSLKYFEFKSQSAMTFIKNGAI